jgi:hypothetical protein
MFADLRAWPTRRRLIAAAVAGAVFALLMFASGLLGVAGAPGTAPWWSYALAAVGSGLIGLVVASYFGAPIGADATLCDTRWPALGLIALYLATDLRSVEPVLTGVVRPVVAVTAIALLAWALRERLVSEHRAMADAGSEDGATCTTCRPLFPPPRSTNESSP